MPTPGPSFRETTSTNLMMDFLGHQPHCYKSPTCSVDTYRSSHKMSSMLFEVMYRKKNQRKKGNSLNKFVWRKNMFKNALSFTASKYPGFLFEKINCCFFQYVQIQQIFGGQKVNSNAVSRQLSWAHFHSGNLKSGPKSCIKAFISGLKSADPWNRKSRIKPSNEIFVKDSWNFGGIWIHIPLRHWKNIAGPFWNFLVVLIFDSCLGKWRIQNDPTNTQTRNMKKESMCLTGYICYHLRS